MKLYELTYLISFDLPEQEVKSLQEKIHTYIVENQGTLDKIEDIVKKRLGNPIKKQTAAYLANLIFYFNPEKIKDLEVKLKAEIQILHYIILTKELKKIAKVPRRMRPQITTSEEIIRTSKKPKKVEIKEIEKKLEEILGE